MTKSPLLQAEVFKTLEPSELKLMEKLAVKTVYPKDEIIFREGDRGDKMYLIVQGVVEIWKSEGKELKGSRLARLEEGELFGEMALFDKEPRSATAIATIEKETVIYVWDEKGIQQFVTQHPEIGVKFLSNLLRKMSNRLRSANDAIHILLRSNQYVSL